MFFDLLITLKNEKFGQFYIKNVRFRTISYAFCKFDTFWPQKLKNS
jgi:hypothetical protein